MSITLINNDCHVVIRFILCIKTDRQDLNIRYVMCFVLNIIYLYDYLPSHGTRFATVLLSILNCLKLNIDYLCWSYFVVSVFSLQIRVHRKTVNVYIGLTRKMFLILRRHPHVNPAVYHKLKWQFTCEWTEKQSA